MANKITIYFICFCLVSVMGSYFIFSFYLVSAKAIRPVYLNEQLISHEYNGAEYPVSQCLSDAGWVLYERPDCIHCQEQKSYFGGTFILLNIVDCNEQSFLCKDLKGTPAWKNGDRVIYGTQSLKQLSDLSNCEGRLK